MRCEPCKPECTCHLQHSSILLDSVHDDGEVTILLDGAFEHDRGGLVDGETAAAKLDVEACYSAELVYQELAAFTLSNRFRGLWLKELVHQLSKVRRVGLRHGVANLLHDAHIVRHYFRFGIWVELVMAHVQTLRIVLYLAMVGFYHFIFVLFATNH